MAGLDSIGSQNPALYAKQNALAGYNDDFMYNAYLSQQNTIISMEAFPLYNSIGPTAANFFQEHITHQFGTLTKLQ